MVVEEVPDGRDSHSLVEEYEDDYQLVAAKELDTPFSVENKGIEGLTAVRHDGRLFLLGLGEPRFEVVEGVAFRGRTRWAWRRTGGIRAAIPTPSSPVAVFDLP